MIVSPREVYAAQNHEKNSVLILLIALALVNNYIIRDIILLEDTTRSLKSSEDSRLNKDKQVKEFARTISMVLGISYYYSTGEQFQWC
jgi:hypothetical protein